MAVVKLFLDYMTRIRLEAVLVNLGSDRNDSSHLVTIGLIDTEDPFMSHTQFILMLMGLEKGGLKVCIMDNGKSRRSCLINLNFVFDKKDCANYIYRPYSPYFNYLSSAYIPCSEWPLFLGLAQMHVINLYTGVGDQITPITLESSLLVNELYPRMRGHWSLEVKGRLDTRYPYYFYKGDNNNVSK